MAKVGFNRAVTLVLMTASIPVRSAGCDLSHLMNVAIQLLWLFVCQIAMHACINLSLKKTEPNLVFENKIPTL